ncbi:MAG: DUF4126 domain-containing protein [Dehalococcoidia bacterium]
MDGRLLGTATAFGLAASTGLNTTLPLLIVALLARSGKLELVAPYNALEHTTTIACLAVLAVFEFVGDKVAVVDSVLHVIQWPLAAAAGAILFASQTSGISWISPDLAIIVGLLTAGAVHGVRTAGRPAVTALSSGMGNPVVSLAEDSASVGLTFLAVAAPLVGFFVTLLVAGVLGWLAIWVGRRSNRVLHFLRRCVGHAQVKQPISER